MGVGCLNNCCSWCVIFDTSIFSVDLGEPTPRQEDGEGLEDYSADC